MKRLTQILEQALGRRGVGLVVLAIVAVAYGLAYFNHPLFPGHDTGGVARGWWTWTDQNRYLVESQAIARLELDAANYFYPIGYPMFGAIFVTWLPVNPFFIPNLLFVLGAAFAWWRLAQRWLSNAAALAVGLVFVITHPWLIAQTLVVPWNTIPTQAALLAGIWIILEFRDRRAVRWLALLAALTYIVRPIDAVTFGPLLTWATLRLPTWRERLMVGTAGAMVVGVAVLAAGGINLLVVGQWRTAYDVVSTQTIGFFSYPISYKFFWLFVDGQPLFGETESALFFRYPWLFLGAAAFIFLIQKEGPSGVAILSAIALNLILYVNYNDLLPSDIYRFTLIHYLSWSFPLLFLLAIAACRHVGRNRAVQWGLGLAVVGLIACLGLRLEPQRLRVQAADAAVYSLPEARPLLIEFPGAPMERLSDLRFDGRTLTEYSDYLVPYVPSDLKLLLGTRTEAETLSIASGG